MTFKLYLEEYNRILTEAIQKTDIVDLYIVLAMPKSEDPAYQFIANEIVAKTSANIISECENVILHEFRHVRDQYDGSIFIDMADPKSLMAVAHPQKSPEEEPTPKDDWVYFKPNNSRDDENSKQTALNFGYAMGLTAPYPGNFKQWKAVAIKVSRAVKWLYSAKNKGSGRGGSMWGEAFSAADQLDHNFAKQVTKDRKRLNQLEVDLPMLNKKFGINLTLPAIAIIFNDTDNWSESYGGEAWGEATLELQKVVNTKKDSPSFLHALDRLVDFVHNNGSLLDKFRGYKEGWFKFILDIKNSAVNLRELFPYASSAIKPLLSSPEWRWALSSKSGMAQVGSSEAYHGLADTIRRLFTGDHNLTLDGVLRLIMNTRNLSQIKPAFEQAISGATPKELKAIRDQVQRLFNWGFDLELPYQYKDPQLAARNKELFIKYQLTNSYIKLATSPNNFVSMANGLMDFVAVAQKLLGISTTSTSKKNLFAKGYDYLLNGAPEPVTKFLLDELSKKFKRPIS